MNRAFDKLMAAVRAWHAAREHLQGGEGSPRAYEAFVLAERDLAAAIRAFDETSTNGGN